MFVGGIMSCLCYLCCLCLFTYNDVQHIVCCVFPCIVCPVLPVPLDCSIVIAPSRYSLTFINNWCK